MYQICPHFGVADDPSTGLLFPSQMGRCFRVEPATAVPLDHQQTFCLSPNHTHCPVYCQTQPAPPPAAVGKQALRRVWLLPTAVFLLLGLGAFVFWQQVPVAAPLPTPAVVAVMAETFTPTPTAQPSATVRSTPVPTETTVLPMATTQPTSTAQPVATETAVSTLETSVSSASSAAGASAVATETAVSTLATTASETPAPPSVVVNVERLNVRSGPSTEYPILLVAEAGATFTVVGSVSARDWWQVCCIEGELAWVVAEAVTFVGNETAVFPATNIPPIPTAEP
jgi:uncharacterized protein YraI